MTKQVLGVITMQILGWISATIILSGLISTYINVVCKYKKALSRERETEIMARICGESVWVDKPCPKCSRPQVKLIYQTRKHDYYRCPRCDVVGKLNRVVLRRAK